MACAASLAVIKVIEQENLLQNIQEQGVYLGIGLYPVHDYPVDFLSESLLIKELTGQGARAAPFVFDIRGCGGFWAIEFDFENAKPDFKGPSFAMLVQARAMENGLIIMGMTGGADLQGNKGDHIILSPSYNITKEEVKTIVTVFTRSINEVLDDFNIH